MQFTVNASTSSSHTAVRKLLKTNRYIDRQNYFNDPRLGNYFVMLESFFQGTEQNFWCPGFLLALWDPHIHLFFLVFLDEFTKETEPLQLELQDFRMTCTRRSGLQTQSQLLKQPIRLKCPFSDFTCLLLHVLLTFWSPEEWTHNTPVCSLLRH